MTFEVLPRNVDGLYETLMSSFDCKFELGRLSIDNVMSVKTHLLLMDDSYILRTFIETS